MSYTTGATGGKYKVSLTQGQMPAHYHTFKRFYYTTSGTHKHQGAGGVSDGVSPNNGSNDFGTTTVGNGESHENQMPYIVVYFFRRTA